MKALKPVFAVIHLQNMIAIYNGQPVNEKAVDLIIVQSVCVLMRVDRGERAQGMSLVILY